MASRNGKSQHDSRGSRRPLLAALPVAHRQGRPCLSFSSVHGINDPAWRWHGEKFILFRPVHRNNTSQEAKIFDIASTLLDVINVVPSPHRSSSALVTQEPREVFHGLSSLLASLSDGNSHLLTLLQSKMAQSPVPFVTVPRLLEVEEVVAVDMMSPERVPTAEPLPTNAVHQPTYSVRTPPSSSSQIRGLGMSDWVT